MTIAEPLAYGEDKSPELEADIHKLARADAAFRQTETANCPLRISAICCAGYQKHPWMKLTVSSMSFKRSAENYRPMAIAFNATLRNTQN